LNKLVIFSLSFWMSAGLSQAHTLFDAYHQAIQNDPQLMASIKDFEAGLKNQAIGLSSLLPKVSASYFQANNDQRITDTTNNNVLRDAYNFPSKNFQVNVIQPIISLEAIAKYKQGLSQADFSAKRLDFAKQDLAIRLIQTYIDLHSTLDFSKTLKKQLSAAESQLKAIQLGRKTGESTITEYLEVEANKLQIEAQLIEAQSMIEHAQEKLKSITGLDYKKIPQRTLSDKFFSLPLTPSSYEEWQKLLLNLNPEINAQSLQTEIAFQEYKKIHGGHFPKVDVVGNWSKQDSFTSNTFNQEVKQGYLGFQVSIPIFSGNEINSRAQQAYLIYEKEKQILEVIRSKNLIELKKEFDMLRFGSLKIGALQKSKIASREAVKAISLSIKTGFRSNIDLLIAEKNLANTEKDLLLSQYNYLLSYIKLKLYAGQFSPADLEQIDRYFLMEAVSRSQ